MKAGVFGSVLGISMKAWPGAKDGDIYLRRSVKEEPVFTHGFSGYLTALRFEQQPLAPEKQYAAVEITVDGHPYRGILLARNVLSTPVIGWQCFVTRNIQNELVLEMLP